MARLVITGAEPRPPPGTLSPRRLEISEFVKDIRQFSLYIQALRDLYNKPLSETASYFQISGIHGAPYADWNESPSDGRGFCVHGTDLFPTWHRPYVALFEQEVQRLARLKAAEYLSDRPAWETAAANLRQPFWGWDVMETVVPPPEVISMEKVEIIESNGERKSVPNPFFTYTFPSGAVPDFPGPMGNWGATARHPDSKGQTRVDKLTRELEASAPQIVGDVQKIYSATNWRDFSRRLENVHGTVHVRAGGSGPAGHMTNVPSAAFDPIFWLHHAQVDRVVDLWYSRHQQWVTDPSDLTPFWNTQTTYWSSPNIFDPSQTFNYSIAGDIALAKISGAVGGASITGATDVALGKISGAVGGAVRSKAIGTNTDNLAGLSEPSADGSKDVSSAVLKEWHARVRCKQFELGGSFSVFVFLGEVPADPEQWITDPNLAGTFDVFANSSMDECANCREHVDVVILGYVNLVRKMLELSGDRSLEPDVVVTYLKDNLNWSVRKANGGVADVDEIPSLEVSVEMIPLILDAGADIPKLGEPEHYGDITSGRPGGSRDA